MDSSFNSSPMIEKNPLQIRKRLIIYILTLRIILNLIQINYFIAQESNESTINNGGGHSNFSLSDSLVNDFLNQNSYTSDESIKLIRKEKKKKKEQELTEKEKEILEEKNTYIVWLKAKEIKQKTRRKKC